MSKTEVALTPRTKLLWDAHVQAQRVIEIAEAWQVNKYTAPLSSSRQQHLRVLAQDNSYGKRTRPKNLPKV